MARKQVTHWPRVYKCRVSESDLVSLRLESSDKAAIVLVARTTTHELLPKHGVSLWNVRLFERRIRVELSFRRRVYPGYAG